MESGIRRSAREVFDRGLKWCFKSTSLRVKAFALIGLSYYRKSFPDDSNILSNMNVLSRHLIDAFYEHSSQDWRWFEPYLTYSNPRLPQSLFLAYDSTGEDTFLDVARESLDFLIRTQICDGIFVPIGNKGWYKKGRRKSLYDQQPVEAGNMIEALSSALCIIDEEEYIRTADIVFDWFFGKNTKGVTLYDSTTGGCFDGISPKGLNLNQGAESTISYLLARLEMQTIRRQQC
jgi:hypothetical protein